MKEDKEGKIAEVIFHNENNFYTILLFETKEEQFFAVGNMPKPHIGRSYHLIGEWTNHPKYGEQFKFTTATELEPTTSDGIAAFLSSGVIKGIGSATARSIVNKFGDKTLEIIRNNPERLLEVSGIGEQKAKSIMEGYNEHRDYADTVMALSAYEISSNICMKLYKSFGSDAVNVVKENPYALIDEVYGIGFKKADKIASSVGIKNDSPYRIKSAVKYLLNTLASSGDTYFPETEFYERIAQFLDVQREQVFDCAYDLIIEGQICNDVIDGEKIIQSFVYNKAEKAVASKIYELSNADLIGISVNPERLIRSEEKRTGIFLSEQQKVAVVSSLKNGVSVITGGPGTGKTTIINTILSILDAAGIKTALAAPTGRAAKRMQSAANHPATTIHRLLEYAYEDGQDHMVFGRNKENPLDLGCLIIDEVSMVDILLMEALVNALKAGTRLLLVGDADQLPPVGAGNVLSDILACDMIHKTKLTDIFRQAQESAIVVNAHLINKGEYPVFNEKDTDFFMVKKSGQKEIQDTIIDLVVKRLPGYFPKLDPYTDIQVLTPSRKNLLGSIELNKALQSALNPGNKNKTEKQIGERIFREGDKVMQIKNNYTLEWKNIFTLLTGQGVFNGDMGIIKSIDLDLGRINVLYDGERLVQYDYLMADEIEPAFAMTVHKSQGSEFPVVVMPSSAFPPMLSTRNLLYTAITRAKQCVVLVGDPRYINAMVDNKVSQKRYSGLLSRLKQVFGI